MAITFSAEVLEAHIAPGVSAFTLAEIPDMTAWSTQSSHWIANFFLNSVFNGSFAPPMNAYAYNFLRRAQYAFSEHELARLSTLAFIVGGSQSVSKYADALFHWECFLGQAWHGFSILLKAWKGKSFEKNDGSLEQRLNTMYNTMKHVESRIDSGQMLSEATVPVWLDNKGLCSVHTNLTYAETAEILKEIAKYADALSDPRNANTILKASEA